MMLMTDNVNVVIKRYENHPSILAFSRIANRKTEFSFNQVTYQENEKLLRNLDTKKTSLDTAILTRLIRLRENSDSSLSLRYINPAGNYKVKVNNRNTRTRCKICSKLTIKTPERRQ